MPAIGAPFGDIKTSGGIMGHLDAILWHLQYGTLAYVGFDVLPPFVTWSVRYEDDAQRQQYLSALSERQSFPRFGLGKFARRFPADPQAIAFRICCSGLLLEDLQRPDVLLADRLNDQPLGIEHGAPLRLVAPAHYGDKNVKHLVAIEFWRDRRAYRFPSPYPALMDHPRAWRSRSAAEEFPDRSCVASIA